VAVTRLFEEIGQQVKLTAAGEIGRQATKLGEAKETVIVDTD
jgi:hypothetical protein